MCSKFQLLELPEGERNTMKLNEDQAQVIRSALQLALTTLEHSTATNQKLINSMDNKGFIHARTGFEKRAEQLQEHIKQLRECLAILDTIEAKGSARRRKIRA